MSVETTFFKESHTSLGVFYPMHYVIAVFDTVSAANQAEKNLHHVGFPADDVLVASGPEFIEFEKRETGMAGTIMREISRFFKTEQLSTDHHLAMAEQLDAFLFVHCPTEELKDKAWAIIRLERPLVAHYYDRISVTQLAGDFSTD